MRWSCFFIRQNNRYERIEFGEILYLESRGNYVRIVTAQKTLLALASLKAIESCLPTEIFCRIHRSYIIALPALTAFTCVAAYIGDRALPISSGFRQGFESRLLCVERDKRSDNGNLTNNDSLTEN